MTVREERSNHRLGKGLLKSSGRRPNPKAIDHALSEKTYRRAGASIAEQRRVLSRGKRRKGTHRRRSKDQTGRLVQGKGEFVSTKSNLREKDGRKMATGEYNEDTPISASHLSIAKRKASARGRFDVLVGTNAGGGNGSKKQWSSGEVYCHSSGKEDSLFPH